MGFLARLFAFIPLSAIEGLLKVFLGAWAHKQDVDVKKLDTATNATIALSGQVLQAVEKHNETKAAYAQSVLQWWPFRVLLFSLLFFPIAHFCMVVIDSSLIWFFTGGYGFFKVPGIPEKLLGIYQQLLLFFVLVKPVDTAVTGALAIFSKVVEKRG